MKLKTLGQCAFMASSVVLAACSSADADDQPSTQPQSEDIIFSSTTTYAISGLAPVEKGKKYLGIYDYKNIEATGENEKPRFFIMDTGTADDGSVTITDMTNDSIDWGSHDQSNDLEGLCALGKNTFLAMESGYYKGDYGRLIELKLENGQLHYMTDYALPDGISDLEGLACAQSRADDEQDVYNLLIGHRETGELLWNQLDLRGGEGQGVLTQNFQPIATVTADASLTVEGEKRAITDLYAYDATVYGIGAVDTGDTGQAPESVIYSLPIDLSSTAFMEMLVENPFSPTLSDYPVTEKISYYKLEAITDYGNGGLLFASDNDGENNMAGAVYK